MRNVQDVTHSGPERCVHTWPGLDPEGAPAMPDRPGEPVVPPAMSGRITRISVTYTLNTGAGARHTFHSLEAMRKHARPERVDELVEDLTLICEDLLVRRPQPATRLPRNVVRLPLSRPTEADR